MHVLASNDCGVTIEKYQKVAEHASSECSTFFFADTVAKLLGTEKAFNV